MTDQDLHWGRMFRSDATVILYRKTCFWRACDGTKPTSYAGSLLVAMLLNEDLSLVLCVSAQSSSISERHFKNAVHPPVSTALKHPYHSYVNIHPAALGWTWLEWEHRHAVQNTTHHKPEAFCTHDISGMLILLEPKWCSVCACICFLMPFQ